MTTDKERAEFEAWAKREHYIIDLREDGRYESDYTESAWFGWQAARANSGWLPFGSEPRDGTQFETLIDGLPYLAKYDKDKRFTWLAHTNVAEGRIYRTHEIDGKEYQEEVRPAGDTDFQVQSFLWRRGFDYMPSHWRPYTPPKTGE